MPLARPYGPFTTIRNAPWPRQRHVSRITSWGLNPNTRADFEKLQSNSNNNNNNNNNNKKEELYRHSLERNSKAQNLAVIGGGITGLTAAFHLSKLLPTAKITVYESAPKLGGWLDSEIVPVEDGKVVFEWGPRTLRHTSDGSGAATLRLV